MEEIKVGEYVRTKKKGIFKVLTITKTAYGYLCGTTDNEHITTFTIGKGGNAEIKNDIENHSEDIVDLIGYGDFINGKMCIDIEHYTRDDGTKGIDFICLDGSVVLKENIKNVVTKEQFKSIEYKLEE